MQSYFFLSETVIGQKGHMLDFTSISRIMTHWPLASEYLWGQWNYIVSKLILIDQGYFCMEDNGLKFTNIWELAHLPKPTKSQFNRFVDFISNRSLNFFTNSESLQNSYSIVVLHVHVALL